MSYVQGPVADGLIVCDYDAPGPENSYPTHTFPSVGSGTVSVTLRASTSLDWQDWTDRTKINLDASMEPTLDSFVDNVSFFSREFGDSGYGNISWIGDIGGRAGGDPRDTYHNVGKALDITWVQWIGGNSCRPLVAASDVSDTTTHRRLVAVEAGLRKWFGYVLNRHVGDPSLDVSEWGAEGPNSKHQTHFHVDNGCHVALRLDSDETTPRVDDDSDLGYRPIRSCHYFLQDCINALTDEGVDYDGIWDEGTHRAYLRLLSDLGMECLDPVRYVNHYLIFLDFIMMHGFANAQAGAYRWGDNAIR